MYWKAAQSGSWKTVSGIRRLAPSPGRVCGPSSVSALTAPGLVILLLEDGGC